MDISGVNTGSNIARHFVVSSHFPVGTTTVTCNAYSAGGSSSGGETFDVVVVLGETPVGDTTPPVIDITHNGQPLGYFNDVSTGGVTVTLDSPNTTSLSLIHISEPTRPY